MENKRFGEWIELKENLHFNGKMPRIHEGEVWWCGVGENVGIEINGKHAMFSRPVLIVKKLSKFGFIGVPLTSQTKSGSWYVEFEFLGKKEWAAIAQVRTFSVSRLFNMMGEVPESDLDKVKTGLLALLK